jgi:hypothetical protein
MWHVATVWPHEAGTLNPVGGGSANISWTFVQPLLPLSKLPLETSVTRSVPGVISESLTFVCAPLAVTTKNTATAQSDGNHRFFIILKSLDVSQPHFDNTSFAMYTKTVYGNFSSYHYRILYEGGNFKFFLLFFAFMPQIPLFAHFRNIISIMYTLRKRRNMSLTNIPAWAIIIIVVPVTV